MTEDKLDTYIRKRLRTLRMTQGNLAVKSGISRQALVKILAGEVRDPRISTVIGIARALQVAPFDLLRAWLVSTGERGALGRSHINGDRIGFVGRENIPNGTLVAPNAMIEKRWTVQNTGDSPWLNRQMRCVTLDDPQHARLEPILRIVSLPEIIPAETFEFTMQFVCPPIPGFFASYWKMTDVAGAFCFPELPPLECIVTVVAF